MIEIAYVTFNATSLATSQITFHGTAGYFIFIWLCLSGSFGMIVSLWLLNKWVDKKALELKNRRN